MSVDEPTEQPELIKKVEALIQETLQKNQREIDGALIKPLSPQYPLALMEYISSSESQELGKAIGYGDTL